MQEMEDAVLFRKLLSSGLMKIKDNDALALPPRDYIEALKASKATDGEGDIAFHDRLIDELYRTQMGKVVRRQVGLWNNTRFFTAVRDNFPTHNDQRNQWQMHAPEFSQLRLPQNRIVPERYGYVTNGKLASGFSDWLATSSKSRRVKYTRKIETDEAVQFEVQLIGSKPNLEKSNGTVARRCAPDSTCSDESADAWVISYNLKPGNHVLEFTTTPIANHERKIEGLNIYLSKSDELQWRWIGSKTPWRSPPVVQSASSTPLTTGKGKATEATWDMGLLPIIGYGTQSTYQLAGVMAGQSVDTIGLTIDDSLQHAANEALQAKIHEFWDGADKYANERRGALVVIDASTGAILAAANYPQVPKGVHPWDIAAVSRVYHSQSYLTPRTWQGLDKNNEPGSIFKPVVAMSAIGEVGNGRKDIQRFLEGYSRRDFDRKSGLTLDSAAYNPLTGKSYPANKIPPGRVIPNFRSGPGRGYQVLGSSLAEKRSSVDCPKDEGLISRLSSFFSGPPRLGLAQAIRDSSNVWFAKLAMLIDGVKANDYDMVMKKRHAGQAKPDYPNFGLSQSVKPFGFNAPPIDLLGNVPGFDSSPRRLFRKNPNTGGFAGGDVLYGHTGSMVLMNPKSRLVAWILAQTGIGQSVAVSPLNMARIGAAIATGKVPTPYLVNQWDGSVLSPPQTEDMNLDEDLLALLQQGMKMVTESGTARRAFQGKKDVCLVYGKTGTANIGSQREYFTTWFMGWREPTESDKRTLAFACMVTHANGNRRTGGSVSAPIVAEMLGQMGTL